MTSYRLTRHVGADADTVAAELTRIHEQHGNITPGIVLSEATDPSAPLHPCFDWNDASAADKYRIQQARHLIRAVHVVTDEGEDAGCMFVNVTSADDQAAGYRLVAEVVEEPSELARAMAGLVQKLRGAQRAIEDLERAASGSRGTALGLVGRHIGRAVSAMERAREAS